jgi:hypothetical protein
VRGNVSNVWTVEVACYFSRRLGQIRHMAIEALESRHAWPTQRRIIIGMTIETGTVARVDTSNAGVQWIIDVDR